jgi:hypothetical protein
MEIALIVLGLIILGVAGWAVFDWWSDRHLAEKEEQERQRRITAAFNRSQAFFMTIRSQTGTYPANRPQINPAPYQQKDEEQGITTTGDIALGLVVADLFSHRSANDDAPVGAAIVKKLNGDAAPKH